LVEHIAEEHGEELRRLCLVCAEAVEDSEGGKYGVEVSIILSHRLKGLREIFYKGSKFE
jgi:hypothetical protein